MLVRRGFSGAMNRKCCWPFKKLYRTGRVLSSQPLVASRTNGRTKLLVSPNPCTRLGAVFRKVEVRHLHAVIVLAEELNFTRAADRLHITQSALSKQITEIEEQHRFHLFMRKNKKNVELTEVGRIFVEEAR